MFISTLKYKPNGELAKYCGLLFQHGHQKTCDCILMSTCPWLAFPAATRASEEASARATSSPGGPPPGPGRDLPAQPTPRASALAGGACPRLVFTIPVSAKKHCFRIIPVVFVPGKTIRCTIVALPVAPPAALIAAGAEAPRLRPISLLLSLSLLISLSLSLLYLY